MADKDHFHQETKVLPLKVHSSMLTKQFLAACHTPGPPGAKHLDLTRPQRNLKHHRTFLDHEQEVKDLLPDVVDSQAYKSAIKSIHISTVANTLQSYNKTRVFQHPPPKVNPEEIKLVVVNSVEHADGLSWFL